jgi:4-amino-4-deoxy-L-arabinose transferase-like glycosyltransferase
MPAGFASASTARAEDSGAGRPRRRRLLLRLLDAAVVLALAGYVASGRASVPFHGDESTFVWLSRDTHTLVETRDPSALALGVARSDPRAVWLRVLNGSLAPLSIGLAWRGAGFSVQDLNGPWQWAVPEHGPGAQWRFNVERGNRPGDALLAAARLPSTLAAAASVALVYALALGLSGSRSAAWLAAGAYASHPAVLLNGRRAMQEGWLLLCSALVVFVAWRAVRAQERPGAREGTLGWLVALAAASGLALAAKHSAAVVVGAALLAVLCAPWLRRRAGGPCVPPGQLASLAGVGLGALAVFSLLTPVWWSPPRTLALLGLAALAFGLRGAWRSRRAWLWRGSALALIAGALLARPELPRDAIVLPSQLLEARSHLLGRQVASFAGDDSPARRVATLLREAFSAAPQYFEDPAWADVPQLRAQIEAYGASWLAGRGGGLAWGAPLAALCAAGVVAAWRRRREPEALLLGAWLALPALALLANPLPWQRYYLVIQAPLAVLAGLGAAWLLSLRLGRGARRGDSLLRRA